MDETRQTETLSRPAPGQLLAEAREARGWSVNEVAMRLKFSPRQIQALEADAYNLLPGPAMIRGMVRSYAKALGVDPQPLVADLELRLNADPLTIVAKPPMHVPLRESAKRGTLLYAGLSLVLVVVVGGLIFHWSQEETQPAAPVAEQTARNEIPAPPAMEAVPAPIETPAAPIVPEPVLAPAAVVSAPTVQAVAVPGRKRIEFFFDEESWVEVKDASGRMLMAQLHPAASEAALEGRPPFFLTVGNAGSVRLIYEGKPVDLQAATRQDVARLTLE